MLTIGMACYDDYDGVYFTVQALKLYHGILNQNIELIVVDNNPGSKHGKAVEALIKKHSGMKYIPFTASVGTAQTRDHIFRVATKDYVLCMDSHVFLVQGALERLIQYYKNNPDTKDLLTGPLLYDDGSGISTHFDLVWSEFMWGKWSNAWKTPDGQILCMREKGDKCEARRVSDGLLIATYDFPFPGHEKHLRDMKWQMLGYSNDDEPFEIQAQGLGIFTCKKSAWPGFNPLFRGFGGEEGYIHEKFRDKGGKCLNLPFLKWCHRFDRPNGVPYPLNLLSRARNYIIGFQELDLDLGPLRAHFVDSGAISEEAFISIIKFPESEIVGNRVVMPRPDPDMGYEDLIKWSEAQDDSLVGYWEQLKPYVEKCDIFTEFTYTPHSATIFLQDSPRTLRSYLMFINDITPVSRYIVLQTKPEIEWRIGIADPRVTLEWTEMLFLGGRANEQELKYYLDQHKMVGRFMVIHNAHGYGRKGDDGGIGVIQVVRDFLNEHKEWFVVNVINTGRGAIVLGKLEEDRPVDKIYFEPPGHGPGTELSKILKWFGINAEPNCPCKARADAMDIAGPTWVEQNIDTILKWLEEEARRRNLPFIKRAAKLIVKRAAKRARKIRKEMGE